MVNIIFLSFVLSKDFWNVADITEIFTITMQVLEDQGQDWQYSISKNFWQFRISGALKNKLNNSIFW